MKKAQFLLLLLIGIGALAISYVVRQGVSASEWKTFDLAKVSFDTSGVPTIEAQDWTTLAKAQGYVVASERLWQMDLYRRAGSGKLAEWFGEKALPRDVTQREENWLGIVDEAVQKLPEDQRRSCEAYADGVNRFIDDHPKHWGIEYAFMRVTPEPWQCRDSLLILMNMAEDLTTSSDNDLLKMQWKSLLTPGWFEFLFPASHPWNVPTFGEKNDHGPALPQLSEALPKTPLVIQEASLRDSPKDIALGSNNWAYRGKKGFYLANDPHLGTRVPQLWYALRLRISQNEWVVGASIPGMPGVIIGMNQDLAWAFTNTGEDVDDWLIENVDMEKKTYMVHKSDGSAVATPLLERNFVIEVKGKGPYHGTSLATHRGPLKKIEWGGKATYASRQWIALFAEMLRLPSEALDRSRNWDEFNQAIDQMRTPSQNVVFMDRQGAIGYRTSGTGVMRRIDGRLPMEADQGEWLGFQPPSARRRKWIPRPENQSADHQFLGTANERVWIDGFSHSWYPDDRKMRMTQVLASRDDLDRQAMEALQRDTVGPYYQLVLNWVGAHSPQVPEETKNTWKNWDGAGESNPKFFTQAVKAEQILVQTLLSRVRLAKGDALKELDYNTELKNAWTINLLNTANGMRLFGLEDEAIATAIADIILDDKRLGPLYSETNHWKAQHPFVKAIPVLGAMFAVNTPAMKGFRGVLRIERPDHAASMRMVWDLSNPQNSSWVFPVGQSGHVWNAHFKDQQDYWFGDKTLPVFPEGLRQSFFITGG